MEEGPEEKAAKGARAGHPEQDAGAGPAGQEARAEPVVWPELAGPPGQQRALEWTLLAPGTERNAWAPGMERNAWAPGTEQALERTAWAPGTERNAWAPGTERAAWAPGTERTLERTAWAPGTERTLERTAWAPGTERALERIRRWPPWPPGPPGWISLEESRLPIPTSWVNPPTYAPASASRCALQL